MLFTRFCTPVCLVGAALSTSWFGGFRYNTECTYDSLVRAAVHLHARRATKVMESGTFQIVNNGQQRGEGVYPAAADSTMKSLYMGVQCSHAQAGFGVRVRRAAESAGVRGIGHFLLH